MKKHSIKKGGSEISSGGDAGEIFIAARKIVGGGKITAKGGDGSPGGKGGKITIISEDNQFSGEISAKGGKSLNPIKWFEKWWGILMLGIIASAIVAGIFLFL
ncbi:MAG: hypothetical protein GXP44_01700 [bacterium]|nr:hypothetical protein [bacterium]